MGSKWGLDTQNYGKVLQLTNLFFDYNHSPVKPIYCITLHRNIFSCLFFIITFLCFMFLIFLISLNFYSFKMFLTLILLFACKLFSVCFHFIVFVLVRDLIVCSLGSSAGFVFWRSSVYPSRSTHHLFPPCLVSFKTDLKQLRQVPLTSGFWKESSGEWWEGAWGQGYLFSHFPPYSVVCVLDWRLESGLSSFDSNVSYLLPGLLLVLKYYHMLPTQL